MNSHVHIVVPGLLPPHDEFAGAASGLRLPALERLLVRAQRREVPVHSFEDWLCAAFGLAGGVVAPVTLMAEGGQPGIAYWLRADPVHLMLRGAEVLLRPVASLTAAECGQLCDSLNRHFSDDGLHFVAPTPRHWYVRLEQAPAISTHTLSSVAGRDIRARLPFGPDALRWHKLLNEIQMLLADHAVNAAREARGEWVINSVWLWGGGHAPEKMALPFDRIYTDSQLAAAFAQTAGAQAVPLPSGAEWVRAGRGKALVAWGEIGQALQHGDLGAWRDSVQQLERVCIAPLLSAVRQGRTGSMALDVLQDNVSFRFNLTRRQAWGFWHRPEPLEKHLGRYPAGPM